MSNRTMLEINHDTTPHTQEERERWVEAICHYLGSGDPKYLPQGVTFFGMRHHTQPCPMGQPPRGWGNQEK